MLTQRSSKSESVCCGIPQVSSTTKKIHSPVYHKDQYIKQLPQNVKYFEINNIQPKKLILSLFLFPFPILQ